MEVVAVRNGEEEQYVVNKKISYGTLQIIQTVDRKL